MRPSFRPGQEPVEIDGPNGRFAIVHVGGMPEAKNAYFYEDPEISFFFYSDGPVRSQGGGYEIVVNHASTHRFEGVDPEIPIHHRKHVMENIEFAFSNRDYFSLEKELKDSEDRPRRISFVWRLRP
jgi:hypothetical protein